MPGTPSTPSPDEMRDAPLAAGDPGRGELVVLATAVVAGIVLRFVSSSDLWLDEALSANIAALPLSEVVDALRRDGHPPFYYVVLHGWSSVFGSGDLALRSLSGLFALATLPLLGWTAWRRRGTLAAIGAVTLAAVAPYATRYATEARMYSLVMLLVAGGWVLTDRLLDRGDRWSAAGLGLVAAMLLYTHYWGIWILAVTGAAFLLVAWRSPSPVRRIGARRGAVALIAAALSFLAWTPVLLDQLAHTGTPWGEAQRPTMSVVIAVVDFAGRFAVTEGVVGAIVLSFLVVLAVSGVPQPPSRIAIDLRTVPGIRTELLVVGIALALGLVVAWISGATFASRYAAFAFPFVFVAAGIGISTGPTAAARTTMASVSALVLVGASLVGALEQRTQGAEAAEAIERSADEGDLVLVCPDQLGPAFSRQFDLDLGVEVLTYPALTGPRFVDWRDYEERNADADPHAIASTVLERAEGSTIWLVWMGGYATYEAQCEQLRAGLATARDIDVELEARPGEVFEPMVVERFPPS